MRSAVETTRWCPVCESRGIPIVSGEPTEQEMRLAHEGRVIIAGCTPIGLHPSPSAESIGEVLAEDRGRGASTGEVRT